MWHSWQEIDKRGKSLNKFSWFEKNSKEKNTIQESKTKLSEGKNSDNQFEPVTMSPKNESNGDQGGIIRCDSTDELNAQKLETDVTE